MSHNLPKSFLEFLDSHTGKQPYEHDDVDWWIATKPTLFENVNIDGVEYRYIDQLQGYTKTVAEFFGGDATSDQDDNPYLFERLSKGRAFATGDGDVLFFDAVKQESIWLFHHDGGDVEWVAESFEKFIQEASLNTDY